MKKSGIKAFISYRRSTGRDVARNIYQQLSFRGINTFFDYNSMRDGKFNEQIYEAIEQAEYFILILSKDALNRCVSPSDWVRIEIEHALQFNKKIIIVNTENEISFPSNLPDSLKVLPSYHVISLNQEYYDESITRLLKMLSFTEGWWNRVQKWHREHLKKSLAVYALSIITISIIVLYINNTWHPRKKQYANAVGLTAKIYLPRYSDIDREILDSTWFSVNPKKDFEYIDTIINEQYSIFPHSSYFSDNVQKRIEIIEGYTPNYHNLPLRLSIHNTKSDTQIINAAQLEVMEIHPISSPIISIYRSTDSLKFVTQIQSIIPRYNLSYSLLDEGESFTTFKNNENIIKPSHNISIGKYDSIHGNITSDNYRWVFDYSFDNFTQNNKIGSELHLSTIAPSSSNVKVYPIVIDNMEAPRQYSISGISRQIVKGEVDDDVYLIIKSDLSFDAKLRIRLVTVTNKEIFTEPISVRYINPSFYENRPF